MKESGWYPIRGFESYKVNQHGDVINSFGKLLSQCPNKKGYMRVWLTNDNIKGKQFFVHRLVAETFIPNPYNYPMINHKDENKSNNSVENLEWCDNTYNQRYSHALKIKQYDLHGIFIKEWNAISDIERDINVPTTNISKCCKGKIKTINGFIFLYEGDSIVDRVQSLSKRYKTIKKKVLAFDLAGILLNSFNSVKEAATFYHCSQKSVIDCCKNRKDSNNNIKFQYNEL